MRAGCVDGARASRSSRASQTGIGYTRTDSPVRLVTNSSDPCAFSTSARKAFGILSRPLSSILAA